MQGKEEIKIDVFGRVQGVGFRHFVKQYAQDLGLKGFVRNKDDGSVFIVAQGEKGDLEEFLRRVQEGPHLSKVVGASYFWRNLSGKYKEFVIDSNKGFVEDQTKNFVNLGKRILKIQSSFPKHVAIIPDGNRRWAKGKGLKPIEGHYYSASYKKIAGLFKEARDLGIEHLTFWAFSTENWKRKESEVAGLFNLVSKLCKKLRNDAIKNKIRFRWFGRRDRLPSNLVKELEMLEEETKKFEGFNVQLCLDYGGRDEILRAINQILKSGVKEIKEDDFKNYLDSQGIPDPDLVIRTSGEKRTSGFMPFQSAYSEFYFTDCNFPDFDAKELRKAVRTFEMRNRNFGK